MEGAHRRVGRLHLRLDRRELIRLSGTSAMSTEDAFIDRFIVLELNNSSHACMI